MKPLAEPNLKDSDTESPNEGDWDADRPPKLENRQDQTQEIIKEQQQAPLTGAKYAYKHRKKIDPRVHEAQEVLSQISKAAKTITIYGHNRASVGRFVESAYSTLTAFLEKNRYMTLMLEGGVITYLDEEIYKEEAGQLSFAYKFYRDGIRKLVFLEGITPKELQDFSYLAAMCSQGVLSPTIDIVSSFWQESFTHLEYTVIDGIAPIFESAEVDENALEQRVDDVFNMIASMLYSGRYDKQGPEKGKGGGGGGIKAVFTDIAASKLASFGRIGIGSIGELSSQATLVPPNYRDFVGKEVEAEDQEVLLQKLMMILLTLVRLGFDEREREDIIENALLMLDTMLVQENFKGIAKLFRRLDKIALSKDTQADYRDRANQFRLKLIEGFWTENRLEQISIMLCTKPQQDADSLITILANLGEKAFRTLPALVERITIPENQKLVCKAFHTRREGLDFVAQELMRSANNDLVIEGLRASALVEFEGKADAIRILLDHQDRNIRLEAIKAIATVAGEEGKQVIAKALEDEDRNVLFAALDAVLRCEPLWAGRTLVRLMTRDLFGSLPSEIQTKFFRTAARTNSPEVFSLFGDLMTKKAGIFHREERRQSRLMVIDALRSESTLVTFNLLSGYIKDPRVPPDIQEYCKKAMGSIRSAITGA